MSARGHSASLAPAELHVARRDRARCHVRSQRALRHARKRQARGRPGFPGPIEPGHGGLQGDVAEAEVRSANRERTTTRRRQAGQRQSADPRADARRQSRRDRPEFERTPAHALLETTGHQHSLSRGSGRGTRSSLQALPSWSRWRPHLGVRADARACPRDPWPRACSRSAPRRRRGGAIRVARGRRIVAL
jgi:hypothetical protein